MAQSNEQGGDELATASEAWLFTVANKGDLKEFTKELRADRKQHELEARIDELEKIDDKASSMTFGEGFGGSVWFRIAELKKEREAL